MNTYRTVLTLILFSVLFPLSGEGTAEAARTGQTGQTAFSVIDALGKQVDFTDPPKRIVTAGKGVLMTADALYLFPEASARIAGIGKIDQGSGNFLSVIDPDFSRKAVLAKNVGPEQIAALRPDLVILKSTTAGSLGRSLQAAGIKTLFLDLETPGTYGKDIDILGTVFNNPDRAAYIKTYLAARREHITGLLGSLSEASRPRVLFLYASDSLFSFSVPPASWIQTELVRTAGGRPVWTQEALGNNWSKVGFEQIAQWNPDVIILASYGKSSEAAAENLRLDEKWSHLSAARSGRIYSFPGDYYSWDQPDPRWILGLTWLARKLHPEIQGFIDVKTASEDFFTSLYGMTKADVEKHIFPLLKGELD